MARATFTLRSSLSHSEAKVLLLSAAGILEFMYLIHGGSGWLDVCLFLIHGKTDISNASVNMPPHAHISPTTRLQTTRMCRHRRRQ